MARVVFLGTPEFGVPILEALIRDHDVVAVVTQPDRAAGRGRRQLAVPPVKQVAQGHGLRILQPARLRRDRATLETLRQAGADVFVLAAFGQILPSEVLAIPAHGCIGVHASLLPKLRGAAPIAAAILQGEAKTGVTLMLTDAGMDTGPTIAQRGLAIEAHDTTGTLTHKLAALGADLLVATMPEWLAGSIIPQLQDESQATYASPIAADAGAIDWRRSAEEIDRLIRAYTPWPGAFTMFEQGRLKILSAHADPSFSATAVPGTTIEANKTIGVVTARGVLWLDMVQMAGRKAMPARQFALGRREIVGAILPCGRT
jgi:methionyl-tRNA formyltransferase